MASETKHSPEPWAEDAVGFGVRDATGRDIWLIDDIDPEDRRRIVACVNACAGLSTEALEAGALGEAIRFLVELERAVRRDYSSVTTDAVTVKVGEEVLSSTKVLRALGRLP